MILIVRQNSFGNWISYFEGNQTMEDVIKYFSPGKELEIRYGD